MAVVYVCAISKNNLGIRRVWLPVCENQAESVVVP